MGILTATIWRVHFLRLTFVILLFVGARFIALSFIHDGSGNQSSLTAKRKLRLFASRPLLRHHCGERSPTRACFHYGGKFDTFGRRSDRKRLLERIDRRSRLLSQAFVVMPNHVHGIVQLATDLSSINGKEASLGQFIRKFKGKSTYMVHKNESASFQWQRNFYDQIIRNDRELTLLRLYIATNPILWNYDPENSSRHEISRDTEKSVMHECGFNDDDVEMIRNYIEYRSSRKR